MGIKANYFKHVLQFNEAGGTSRGVLHTKDSYIITLEKEGRKGLGEVSIIPKLSIDARPDLEEKIKEVLSKISYYETHWEELIPKWPAIAFAIEMALLQLNSPTGNYFQNEFSEGKIGIPINGLIWMGPHEIMQQRIAEKLDQKFDTIKLKIGAIDWNKEVQLIEALRTKYPKEQLCIRVDANGAFKYGEALEKLNTLKNLRVHSIEQPLAKKDSLYPTICENPPIPIALDEELIGVSSTSAKKALLEHIRPQYIILKPSLVGGFKSSLEWIEIAESLNIGWWITSALESNIGLNAIAQFTAQFKELIPQGLGTGGVFSNNFDSNLEIRDGHLWTLCGRSIRQAQEN